MVVLRVLFAAPLYLSILAYMIDPNWMAWSAIGVPAWLRWLAAFVGVAMVPIIYWVVSTIGKNISETFLTKDHHSLVTHGPYRWVRYYNDALLVDIRSGQVVDVEYDIFW